MRSLLGQTCAQRFGHCQTRGDRLRVHGHHLGPLVLRAPVEEQLAVLRTLLFSCSHLATTATAAAQTDHRRVAGHRISRPVAAVAPLLRRLLLRVSGACPRGRGTSEVRIVRLAGGRYTDTEMECEGGIYRRAGDEREPTFFRWWTGERETVTGRTRDEEPRLPGLVLGTLSLPVEPPVERSAAGLQLSRSLSFFRAGLLFRGRSGSQVNGTLRCLATRAARFPRVVGTRGGRSGLQEVVQGTGLGRGSHFGSVAVA